MTQKQLKLRYKQWINTHIQKLIKQRDRLLRKLRKSHSRDTKELCKKFRNRVVSENTKTKIKYFDNYFSTNKADMKNLWTGIKTIINTESKSSLQNIFQLVVNGKFHQDPQQMANVFNDFFANVSNQICSEISRTKKSPPDYLKNKYQLLFCQTNNS